MQPTTDTTIDTVVVVVVVGVELYIGKQANKTISCSCKGWYHGGTWKVVTGGTSEISLHRVVLVQSVCTI